MKKTPKIKKKKKIGKRVDGRTLAGKRRKGKSNSKQPDKHNLFARVSKKRRAAAAKKGRKLRSTGLEITAQQAAFVDHYLGDANLNAKKAAILAGYSDKRPDVQGCLLLRNPKVRRYLRKRMHNRTRRMELSQNQILIELINIANAKPKDFAYWNGNTVVVKSSDEIPRHLQGAIKSIEPKFAKDGTAALKITFHDKLKALEMLMRHLGMLEITQRDGSKGTIVEFMEKLHMEAARKEGA